MEVFLLLFDELDDAIAVLRSLWPRLLGALLAIALMLATGFICLRYPVPAIAVFLSATLIARWCKTLGLTLLLRAQEARSNRRVVTG